MEFSEIIKTRRAAMHLGVRETARLTDRPWIPAPIKSAVYISRLENKVIEEQRADAVSIDKCWAIGSALQVHPLVLFATFRSMPDLQDQIGKFAIRESADIPFNVFLKNTRLGLGLTLQEVSDKAEALSPWGISFNYLSDVEIDRDGVSERLSAEKMWALGMAYSVDPLLMYVMSRHVDPKFLVPLHRDRLFS
jgi:transcriptional regulator with XRE-family HTH domain